MVVPQRLVKTDPREGATLALPATALAVFSALLAMVPSTYASVEQTRPYVPTALKQFATLGGGALFLGLVLFLALQIAVGAGVLGVVYGKVRSDGVSLVGPLGFAGARGQRVTLGRDIATVELISEAPMRPLYRYGMQRIRVEQGGDVFLVSTYVRLSDASVDRFIEWLRESGVTPVLADRRGEATRAAGTM